MPDYPNAVASIAQNTSRFTQVSARRQEVASMYLRGFRQTEIAEHFGVNQSVISRDLLRIRQEWIKSSVRDFDAMRAQELAKIDTLEQEYWNAWRRSQENAEVRTTKARSLPPPKTDAATSAPSSELEVTDRSEGQSGDPRFLAGVQWCIERRCAILGLDEPKSIGVMVGNKTIEKATDTELTLFILSEIALLLQPAKPASTPALPIDAAFKDPAAPSSPSSPLPEQP